MKKLIMITVIAACLALCAAVWPQNEVVEETPVPTQTPAVCAPEATVAELKFLCDEHYGDLTEEQKEFAHKAMWRLAAEEGRRAIEENERLKADPNFEVPASLHQKALELLGG